MYDRKYGEKELNFEASGALWQASLVMRDRETDSWWSIMTSAAIGGAMDGQPLRELPYGEKSTWADWVAKHPQTLVLSVDGKEHVDENPYDKYFASDATFRDMAVQDDRLKAKEPVFTFHHDGKAWAAPHASFAGGRVFEAGQRQVYLYREKGASIFASTAAFFVAGADEVAMARRGETDGLEAVEGFDTFWYNWIAVNKKSKILE